MSFLERLEQEHREVLERFGLLATTLQRTETEGVRLLRDSGDLAATSDFLKNKIPAHFASEEEVLFPFLERIIPAEKRLIAELLDEHEKIRKDISTLLGDIRSPEVPLERIRSLLAKIAENISAHAMKEDQKLLPLARKYCSEDQLKELDRLVR